jgi:AAA15 family ATPase/GTPase
LIGRSSFAPANLAAKGSFAGKIHLKAIPFVANQSKAQLLVASYDMALLDRNLLRRDQIYFVEKDKYGATEITALMEYKSRKESPYDKNYLVGKYGAIPFIDGLESLMVDDR